MTRELREALVKVRDARVAFVEARERMNATIPALDASPAERALYDERYQADHKAERAMWTAAIEFAQWIGDNPTILASLDTEAVKAETERCERICEAEMAKCNLYVERGLGGEAGIEMNTARYQTARSILAAIRARKEQQP